MNEKKYVCSRLTQLIRCDAEWMLSNPALDSTVYIEPPGSDLIVILQRLLDWLQISHGEQDILNWLKTEGFTGDEAVLLMRSFIQAGLLVFEGSELPWAYLIDQQPGLCEVLRYTAFRRSVRFVDYTDPQVLYRDRESMKDFERSEPPPSIYKHYQNAPRMSLGHPATYPPHDAFGRLSHLLYWGFGRLREVAFHQLPAMLKAVPSMGARHPFEAYVLNNNDDQIETGLYHYGVERHELEYLSSVSKVRSECRVKSEQLGIESDDSQNGISLIITVVFDRFQWRYRHAWSYKDIFFDFGHIQATLKLVAEEFGVSLKPVDMEIVFPEVTPLFEEVISVYELECL